MAELQQVVRRRAHPRRVVERRAARVHARRDVAVDEDDRHRQPAERLDRAGVVLLGEGKDQPVDPAPLEQGDVLDIESGLPSELVSSSE